VNWGRFEGCFARLDRAREHRVEFGAEWARYIEGHPAELSVHVDNSGRGTGSVVRYRRGTTATAPCTSSAASSPTGRCSSSHRQAAR
jgi:hypothetical protein